MSLSITRATTSPIMAGDMPVSASRQAFKQLGQALKAGDVDAAKTAYAAVVKNAPRATAANPDGAFAQVGQALNQGDLAGAQDAFKSVLKNGVDAATQPIKVTNNPILVTGTGGTVLNLFA